jgi:nitrogenase molybdenum-cofactor synthesis protein NifE
MEEIRSAVSPTCVLMDDATPEELCVLAQGLRTDLILGDVEDGLECKVRGIPFLLHNQQTASAREGFAGCLRFATDINEALFSPIWDLVRPYDMTTEE